MSRLTPIAGALVAAALIVGGCASGPGSAPPLSTSATASVVASPSPAATASAAASPTATTPTTPTSFTSETYGYILTLPAGWTSKQATSKWDGISGLSSESAEVDEFIGPADATSTGVAAPTNQKLAAYADALIVATVKYHGDTCPPKPEAQDPITIGGEPGILVQWNCGILINNALTVHNGVGYQFLLRDRTVHAATDPADQAVFLAILESLKFP